MRWDLIVTFWAGSAFGAILVIVASRLKNG